LISIFKSIIRRNKKIIRGRLRENIFFTYS